MDLYEPVKLFKAGNMHTRWYLETMEWCSEDIIITSFCKILLKFAIVLKIFENFCLFLSLTIITGQRSFSSLADGLREKIQRQKIFLKMFFTVKCGNFSLEFCTLSFFLYDLVTNKFRKLEVVESNLIIEKIPSSLALSVLAGVCFLLAHV